MQKKLDVQDCFLCRKHAGLEAKPPGGYIYADENWMVCHAPPEKGPLGSLFIESRRHLLDFAEMTGSELHSYGELLGSIYPLLKTALNALRVYSVVLLEGVPHFHNWLIPRRAEDQERGMKLLMKDLNCDVKDAEALASQLEHQLTK